MSEERLHSLVSTLRERFDPQYADALLLEVNYGESTMGVENLIDNLLDDEVTLDPDLVRELMEIARLVGADPRRYELLAAWLRGRE